jgi:uncharacterized protein (DUF983 family)
MSEITKNKAFLKALCPRCRRGHIFLGRMYGLKPQKMHERCPHCSMKFEVEPGYFYAAMYVSYALNVAEGVSLGILTYLITGSLEFDDVWLYLTTIIGGCLLLAPFNFRYSRVVLLYWLSPKVKYDPHYNSDKA